MINYFKTLIKIFNSLGKYTSQIKYSEKNLLHTQNDISFEKIIAHKNLPVFRNSAMDGYCVYSNTINNNLNKRINIQGTLNAGKSIEYKKIDQKVAFEIMTGAKIPSHLDSVIKIEDVYIKNKEFIIINKHIKKNENVRKIGEDFKVNDIIIKKMDKLNFNNISCLSAFGVKNINILKQPNILFLATGNEISNYKYTLKNTQSVNNSSYTYIAMFFKSLGLKIKYLGTIKDHISLFLNIIKKILTLNYFSIFITTGAVSKGSHDFIPLVLKKLGVKILIHHVDIKPGKPILIAKYKKHVYFFCLPGNPISSIIGARFFILPFINYFFYQKIETPILAKLKKNFKIKIKKDTFLKGQYNFNNTFIFVNILNNQESFKIKPLLYSNCFIFIKKNDIINKKVNIYLNHPDLTNIC